jgi:hypothetical protein
MGSGSNPWIKPELFPAQQPPDASSPAASEPKSMPGRGEEPAAVSPSYALPTNLPNALRHLDNAQLDRLFAAVLAEQQARGDKKLPLSDEPSHKRPIKEVAPPLAQGKLNAVRAAFKAASRRHELPDSSEFRSRTCGRRWHPMKLNDEVSPPTVRRREHIHRANKKITPDARSRRGASDLMTTGFCQTGAGGLKVRRAFVAHK